MKQLDHKNTMWKSFNGRTPNKDDVLAVHEQAAEIDRKMCAPFHKFLLLTLRKDT